MSLYSDWKCGALSDEDYYNYGAIENRRERYEATREHTEDYYTDDPDDPYWDDEDSEDN